MTHSRPLAALWLWVCVLTMLWAAGCRVFYEQAIQSSVRSLIDGSWIEARAEELTVLSLLGPEETRSLTEDLLAFRAAVEVLAPQVGSRSPVPTYVYLLTPGSYPVLGSRSAGFFTDSLRANHLVVRTSTRGLRDREILFHEYTHFLFANAPALDHPLWLNEGFADFLSTLEVGEGRLRIGAALKARVEGLKRGGVLSVESVMAARRYPALSRGSFYSTSWLLTHYLSLGHRVGFVDRRGQLQDYLRLLREGVDGNVAFESAFALSYKEMERELVRYARSGLAAVELPVPELAARPEVRLRRLPAADLKLVMGELLIDLAREDPDLPAAVRESARSSAEALFAEAVSESGAAAAYAGWAASELRDLTVARARFEQALERAPEDPAILASYANQLLDFAEREPALDVGERSRLLEEARRRYRSALAQAPALPAALAGLGRTCLSSGVRIEEGIPPLERLRTLRRNSLATLTLARIYARVERPDDARRLAREVLAFAHHSSYWADQASQLIAELPPDPGVPASRLSE